VSSMQSQHGKRSQHGKKGRSIADAREPAETSTEHSAERDFPCVGLTNWDAEHAASSVSKGTLVKFVDTLVRDGRSTVRVSPQLLCSIVQELVPSDEFGF
jgi:hypothetical protein